MVMRIKELRKQANKTQMQLAAEMQVTQNCVSGWETGVALPRTRQLPDLARVLGCTIDELFVPEPASTAMEAV
ncbi:MAG: helix-turn-helix transcriptional regulator [bacterium]|nr:helix-turn-helix transcriptional regulator [bacterium]